MSERDLRRRIPAYRRATSRSRAGKQSPSPSPSRLNIRRSRQPVDFRSKKQSENSRILQRSKSEPLLWRAGGGESDRSVTAAADDDDDVGVLYRPQTCTDIFSSPENSVHRSPKSERYNKDSKVVVTVTVEGSPGPIRTMVKLGCSVEEMIKLVIRKYTSEGRTPCLDKDFASRCELHHSYFSLQGSLVPLSTMGTVTAPTMAWINDSCGKTAGLPAIRGHVLLSGYCLNKSAVIGNVDGRSFYLRKHRSDQCEISFNAEIVPVNANNELPFFPSFICQKMNKIMRRTQKLWKLLGCI